MKQKEKKVIDLISQLEIEMDKRSLSTEDMARLIGCSYSQLYRWYKRESKPTFLYRKAIERTLKKLRRTQPVVTLEMAAKDRDLYRTLKKKISIQEKQALFNHATDDYSAYQKELQRLAEKYNIKD